MHSPPVVGAEQESGKGRGRGRKRAEKEKTWQLFRARSVWNLRTHPTRFYKGSHTKCPTRSHSGPNQPRLCLSRGPSCSRLDHVFTIHYLEYAGTIRSSPCIQQIVLPCAHKPFTCKQRNTHLENII